MRAMVERPVSVVVEIVHEHGVGAVEAECHAPVAADPDRIVPFEVAALQRMQAPARQVHALRIRRFVQAPQHGSKPWCMGSLNAGHAPFFEEGFQAFVPKRIDHAGIVSRNATGCRCKLNSVQMLMDRGSSPKRDAGRSVM